MTTSIEAKREEFRRYLEESGVVNALTKALIKLYEEEQKPQCAVKFVREQMCETCATEEMYNDLKVNYEDATENITVLNKELTSMRDNLKRSPSEVNIVLETGLLDLEQDDACRSLLKKYLNRDIFNALKEQKTATGATLLDCIQSGLEHHDGAVGIYASDVEAYTVFADLFDPIIEDYHLGFDKDAAQPEITWGDPMQLTDVDPDGKYVQSIRVRAARSVEGYPFMAKMTDQQYRELLEQVRTVFENMEGEFKGKFHALLNIDPDVAKQLADENFMFQQGDRFLMAAKACRFWPQGRGLYCNEEKTFLVWVNEEDHLRIMSMQPGGDLGQVYQRLISAVQTIAENVRFVRTQRLGNVSFSPTNLGTGLHASAHIRLPLLGADCTRLQELATRFNLIARGVKGELTDVSDWVYDLSNRRTVGLTEFDVVKEMHAGILEIIKAERELEAEQ